MVKASGLIAVLLALGSLAYWINQSREQQYPDAPSGQFACLSYTPRSDSSRGAAPDIHAQIDRDLQQLSQRTRCVRTYSVMNGLDYVPEAARKLGMRVLLGIWIGSNSQANEMELAQAIITANAHRDVIDAIVVGNEVLLRREQTAAALYVMLQRVHAATQLPVTYADVWDFWLKNPTLAGASDFITIHILPYWDDEPIGVDHAMAHVQNIFDTVQKKFPGRHIYVGETGWPSAGRQRESATPSLTNQARFTREFIAFASAHDIPYNFIEAYDQPWKKRLEGTVGGYWGLYDAEGIAKFPLTGAVVSDVHWWRGPVAGVIVALLLLGVTHLNRSKIKYVSVMPAQAGIQLSDPLLDTRLRGYDEQNQSRLLLLLHGFSMGAIGMLQWIYLWQSNRNWLEWSAMLTLTLLGHAVFLLHVLQQNRWPHWTARLHLALLLGMAYINLGLVFDARYRDFPSLFVLLPASVMLLDQFNATSLNRKFMLAETTLLQLWLVLSSLLIGVIEGPRNTSALFWCALCLLLGGSSLWRTYKAQRH